MLTLKFSTANDAFGTTEDERNAAMAGVLKEVSWRVLGGAFDIGRKEIVRDINGNIIGSFIVSND